MIWYKEHVDKIYEILETSERGISKSEANKRLNKYGPNLLSVKGEPLWKLLIEPFRSAFVGVLVIAALVSGFSHEVIDALIISAIILINAGVFYAQQYATSRVLRSLKRHSLQDIDVIRDGLVSTIISTDLVPGDIIIINEGERVPADARVISVDNLQVNEASLTGESTPVHKHASVLTNEKQVYERDNMLFQGTYILSGSAKALIVETGSRTEFGRIAQLVTEDKTKSPVQEKIDSLITILVKATGVIAVVVFGLALARGIPTTEALRFVLSMAVSAVPEGLPVALTVIIVLGMRRMAKHKALVRSFKAIEDIGLITTIATDKTGTLTKNKLSVIDSWALDDNNLKDVAAKTIDANNSLSDPLDIALGEHFGKTNAPHIDKVYPFELSLRMSGTYIARDKTVYIKGSPEHILSLSELSDDQRHQAESATHTLASEGYRVIAFCTYSAVEGEPNDLSHIKKGDITFVGFLAFADILRSEAAGAIKRAHEAGIHVRLITGDHYETAYNIGKKIGLATHPSQVIQGTELPKDCNELALAIRDKTVFSRILPEDKFRILQALKETEITAMTGDGVNDVPALANAHVGIAMGSGSDIARDAGDIVLLNDNFSTIVKAIDEGRKIFDNIRRMLFYLLSTAMGEVITMVGALVLGLPLPVAAIQILWINVVTDTTMALPLGLEPEEEGHMKRPPRHPKAPLLSKVLLSRIVLVAITMAVVALGIVITLKSQGQSTPYIQTVTFMALVAGQWMNTFNARSEFTSSFARLKRNNYGLLVGFGLAVALQWVAMFSPLKHVFGIEDVPFNVLLISSAIMAAAILIVVEVHKFIARRFFKPTAPKTQL